MVRLSLSGYLAITFICDPSYLQSMTSNGEFPTTRFQGSKRDIADWIWDQVSHIEFDSVLDAFGGTGSIAYKFKSNGVETHYNDYLKFNYHVGRSIIENSNTKLDDSDVKFLLQSHDEYDYPTFIQEEFEDIYYTDEENAWLDRMHVNINQLDNKYKRSIAYSALSQSALAKRPYNLFHRANLYMRTDETDRSFGNKTTWDRSFDDHFKEKVKEFNGAVFDNGRDNKCYNQDVLNWNDPPDTDIVYLDPPYYDDSKKNGGTNYQFYYHFLDGFLQYDDWEDMIDDSVKTKRLEHEPSPWTKRDEVKGAFETVFDIFEDRDIVLSYNTAGYPTPEDLKEMLESIKDNVSISAKDYQYALSKKEDSADEILIVAYDE